MFAMSHNKKMQQKKSLCEQSMQMMVNIIKLSSFSLSTINLGNKHSSRLIPTEPFSSYSSNSNLSKSNKSNSPLTKSYLMEKGAGDQDHPSRPSPYVVYQTANDDDDDDDGNFSDYIKRFHKRNHNEVNKEITNGKATAYIRKFHEKNSRDYTLASSSGVPLVLPPPPPLKK